MFSLHYLESFYGYPIKVSLEALNAASQLDAQTVKMVAAVLVGDDNAASYGADEVLTVAADGYQADAYTAIRTAHYERYEVFYLLLGSTCDGKERAARVTARVGASCISDAMSLTDNGAWVRSIYGSALQETVTAVEKVVVTVRSGTFGRPVQNASTPLPSQPSPWIMRI